MVDGNRNDEGLAVLLVPAPREFTGWAIQGGGNMRGGDYLSTLEKPAGVNTAHREPAICIEIMPPVLRSPHSGGPLIERARCEIGGIIYQAESTSGAICKLCRVLVAAGVPDSLWQAFRGGKLAISGRSVHRMAERIVSEGDKYGLRWGKWRPYPER